MVVFRQQLIQNGIGCLIRVNIYHLVEKFCYRFQKIFEIQDNYAVMHTRFRIAITLFVVATVQSHRATLTTWQTISGNIKSLYASDNIESKFLSIVSAKTG